MSLAMDRRVFRLCLLLFCGGFLFTRVNCAPAGEIVDHVQRQTGEDCFNLVIDCLSEMNDQCYTVVIIDGAADGGDIPALLACCGEVSSVASCIGVCLSPAYIPQPILNNLEKAIATCGL
uniref:Uncharacterized protein n=1 Tax=Rhodosorus marinus TaxID=101924 RepID=A0A7S2ZEK1_9RHOD|mmetsp:Transcript_167/g.370  ORF Transcript_167/g.370 Transcript_167/m.370 type:complete len:120 (+) Transcript_167:145-504(+)